MKQNHADEDVFHLENFEQIASMHVLAQKTIYFYHKLQTVFNN